jgi:NADP-dependent 3-hydroxy acid dehydrogenase YdfG
VTDERSSDVGRPAQTVSLVTGASSGIGEATARALAAEGSVVAVVARRRDRLEALAAEIEEGGGKALVIEADVTDGGAAREAVETAAGLGRLDVVINNAGGDAPRPAVDAPLEEWERMVQLNVMGLLYVAHAALPHLLRAADDDPRHVADLVKDSSVSTAPGSTRLTRRWRPVTSWRSDSLKAPTPSAPSPAGWPAAARASTT